jgi:hypothetical protein
MKTKGPRRPRTIADLRADPRVLRVYRDSDGLWVDLRDGWKNSYDEPKGALHGIHEDTLKEALVRMPHVVPCDCEWCAKAADSASPIQK